MRSRGSRSARTRQVLERKQIAVESVSNGITMGGGTPAHRWLRVAVNGLVMDDKVMADSELEPERVLDRILARRWHPQGITLAGKARRLAGGGHF